VITSSATDDASLSGSVAMIGSKHYVKLVPEEMAADVEF